MWRAGVKCLKAGLQSKALYVWLSDLGGYPVFTRGHPQFGTRPNYNNNTKKILSTLELPRKQQHIETAQYIYEIK